MDETQPHIRLVPPVAREDEIASEWCTDLPSRAIHPSVLDSYLADLRRRRRARARLRLVEPPVIDV